jgi:membrane protease YdiL (CAAX protease family)
MSADTAPNKRLYLFLVVTFAISWTAWWSLATVLRPTESVFAHPLSAALFLIGGLGPTIAPFIAVALTQPRGGIREYLTRLFRWRLSPIWWLAALAVPPAIAWLVEHIEMLNAGPTVQATALQPLSRVAVLFPLMIVGGGLEELGWRGVAQPELERRFNAIVATAAVGLIWALWHLPLFFIPGAAQFGTNFGFFTLQILGTAFVSAWLYDNTKSILLCVLFHAAANASSAMGLSAPDVSTTSVLLGSAARLAIGVALIMSVRSRAAEPLR